MPIIRVKCRTVSFYHGWHKIKQEAQLLLGKADHTAYFRSSASNFQSRRESNLSEVRQFYAGYVNGTLSRKLQ